MAILHVTTDNFENEVLACQKPVLLDFWAEWCGPCRMIAPILEEIANENDDIVIAKVNVDEDAALATAFQVVSIPSLFVIKDGKIVNQAVGALPKERILELLK